MHSRGLAIHIHLASVSTSTHTGMVTGRDGFKVCSYTAQQQPKRGEVGDLTTLTPTIPIPMCITIHIFCCVPVDARTIEYAVV
mmetsp:Transcript_27687/g.61314  ORF Transcript_27687/g.61314 Transcript_27687/m.61314 type:complete len:83 (+) Transcript_27687:323-571(+)